MSFLALLMALGNPEAGTANAMATSSGKWAALLPDLSLGLQYQTTGPAVPTEGGAALRLSATTVLLVEARWPLAALETRSTEGSAAWNPATPAPRSEVVPGAASKTDAESVEPSVSELQEAAEVAAAVHLVELPDWKGRARSSALLPELSAGYRRTVGDVDTYGIRSEVGIDSHNIENLSRYDVRATWQLSQLVFSRDELLAASTALEVQRSRQELLARIADHYYERRRLQLLLRDAPAGSTTGERQELQLRIDQQTATLDALTAGYLSRALDARRAGLAR